MKLDKNFFERNSVVVARELLGCTFEHKTEKGTIKGIITETEAYGGHNDLASHARFGLTERNKIMYGQPGVFYVYHIYGIYFLTNIICEPENNPAAILIRSAEIIRGKEIAEKNIAQNKFAKLNDKLAVGPGKFSLAFGIDKSLNYLGLASDSQISMTKKDVIKDNQIIQTTRVGVDYAGTSKDLPWRFYIKDSQFVSKK